MIEKDIENKIKLALKDLDLYYIKTHGNIFSKKGTPDLIINYKGCFCAIEVKMRPNKVTELQKKALIEIKKQTPYVFIVDDIFLKEFLEYLRSFNEQKLIWLSERMFEHYKILR